MNNNIVISVPTNNSITVVTEENTLAIANPVTSVVQVNTPGPQGPKADLGQIPTSSSEPANPQVGTIYFDTSLQKLRLYNGTQWLNLSFE